MPSSAWSIPGSNDQPILGNTDLPQGSPRGVIILCHGFKGYKDYGLFPQLAQHCADRGLVAHRLNFSHSGMTNNLDTFERPDLFANDTWSKQVDDLTQVNAAVREHRLPGQAGDLPLTWFGHSRGGVTAILAAAHLGEDGPDRLVTAAAPDACCSLDQAQQALLLSQGYLDSPSGRTGQRLRVNRIWLDEILADPERHDPPAAMAKVTCPTLIVHGDADDTVKVAAAETLYQASGKRAKRVILPGATHVFNAPNPLPLDAPIPPQTQQLFDLVAAFALTGG